MSDDHTQTEPGRRQHLEVIARRLNALPLHWDDKVEIWQQETGLSETTFARILRESGESVPD